MKYIYTLLLFPFLLFSQPENEECRIIMKKGLELAYHDVPELNFYLKGYDLHVDVEVDLPISHRAYQELERGQYTLNQSSKDNIYKLIETMKNCGVFNESDVEECTFKSINFKMIYSTTDKVKLVFRYAIAYFDVVKIKDNLNKGDVFQRLREDAY